MWSDLLRRLLGQPRQDPELRRIYLNALETIARAALDNGDPEISVVLYALLGERDDKAGLRSLSAIAAEAAKCKLIADELKRDPRCVIVHQN